MKRLIIASLALAALSGCAVPAEMRAEQKVETQALRAYHKAERQEYRASEAAKITKGVNTLAQANKAVAALNTQKAKADLVQALNE
ncbi:hypothetical protein AhyVDH1_026 [Aeromonas phage AhyVDH1]|nr:hypothetical protein AhyVDH1_026 [Aeromonas phage AhyVDH1]